MIKLDGGFIQNLGWVYGLYTLGFLGFVILMAIFEAAGVSNTVIGWLFVAFTVGIYAMIGVLSRTMESKQFIDITESRPRMNASNSNMWVRLS